MFKFLYCAKQGALGVAGGHNMEARSEQSTHGSVTGGANISKNFSKKNLLFFNNKFPQ